MAASYSANEVARKAARVREWAPTRPPSSSQAHCLSHPPAPERSRPNEPVTPPARTGTTDGNIAANTDNTRNVDGSDVARRPAKSTSARQKEMEAAPSLRDTPRGGCWRRRQCNHTSSCVRVDERNGRRRMDDQHYCVEQHRRRGGVGDVGDVGDVSGGSGGGGARVPPSPKVTGPRHHHPPTNTLTVTAEVPARCAVAPAASQNAISIMTANGRPSS